MSRKQARKVDEALTQTYPREMITPFSTDDMYFGAGTMPLDGSGDFSGSTLTSGEGRFFNTNNSQPVYDQTAMATLNWSNEDGLPFFFDETDSTLFPTWSPESTSSIPTASDSADYQGSQQKRSRTEETDDWQACWKSSLCPSQKEDGSKPEDCNGECAPFLFADSLGTANDDLEVEVKPEAKIEVAISEQTPKMEETRAESAPHRKSSRRSAQDKAAEPTSRIQAASDTEVESKAPRKSGTKPKGRVPHSEVEKKYRENVNAQLEALRQVVPAQNALGGFDRADIEDLPARQASKAAVMSIATAYIKQLKKDNGDMERELKELREKNRALQSLAKCDDCSLMKYIMRLKLQGSV
jgi:hypothetical protein